VLELPEAAVIVFGLPRFIALLVTL
jgi:hypothetical protein